MRNEVGFFGFERAKNANARKLEIVAVVTAIFWRQCGGVNDGYYDGYNE